MTSSTMSSPQSAACGCKLCALPCSLSCTPTRAAHGGRDGRPLAASTVSHIHRTLCKALADAVDVEQLLAVNPAERSKRPRNRGVEPSRVWTTEQLGHFLGIAQSHRLFAFYRLA